MILLFLVLQCVVCESSWAKFVIHSQNGVDIELVGYNGLADVSLFKGSIPAGSDREIDTLYRGLALLIYGDGQRYPVIIGNEFFTLKIPGPADRPSFTGSGENEFFYRLLSGGDSGCEKFTFPLLMIQAMVFLSWRPTLPSIGETHKIMICGRKYSELIIHVHPVSDCQRQRNLILSVIPGVLTIQRVPLGHP